mgnify:CR=1 FL=1
MIVECFEGTREHEGKITRSIRPLARKQKNKDQSEGSMDMLRFTSGKAGFDLNSEERRNQSRGPTSSQTGNPQQPQSTEVHIASQEQDLAALERQLKEREEV